MATEDTDVNHKDCLKLRFESLSVPAEVRYIDGKWKAVRLDGKPRIDDKFPPPAPGW